ncbi:MAG: hypothetical protein AAGF92_17705 [Myxococcota bacterium]
MGSLVLDLQRAALDNSIKITQLVRTALAVARKLNLTEVDGWLRNELNGYVDREAVPDYRVIGGKLCVETMDRLIELPFDSEEDRIAASTMPMGVAIAELEHAARAKGKPKIRVDTRTGQVLYLVTTHAALETLLDRVRTKILDWSLDLEEQGIVGESMLFTADEKKAAHGSPSVVNIFHGDVGQANLQQSSSGVQVGTQKPGADLAQLAEFLRAHLDGLSLGEQSKAELDAAISDLDKHASGASPDKRATLTTLGRVRDILVAGAAANELIQAVTEALAFYS